jgi:hypothetical protein
MSHEADPKYSGLDEIKARRALFTERLSEMGVVPCDVETGEVIEAHPVIRFPHARRHDPDIAEPGEW